MTIEQIIKNLKDKGIDMGTIPAVNERSLVKHEVEGKVVKQRETDGYFNATEMCKSQGKLFNDYYRLNSTNDFITELAGLAGIPVDLLIQINKKGANNTRGTWVHPRVAIHLAMWASPKFANYVIGWFEEWTKGNNISLKDAIRKDDLREYILENHKEVKELLAFYHHIPYPDIEKIQKMNARDRVAAMQLNLHSILKEVYPTTFKKAISQENDMIYEVMFNRNAKELKKEWCTTDIRNAMSEWQLEALLILIFEDIRSLNGAIKTGEAIYTDIENRKSNLKGCYNTISTKLKVSKPKNSKLKKYIKPLFIPIKADKKRNLKLIKG